MLDAEPWQPVSRLGDLNPIDPGRADASERLVLIALTAGAGPGSTRPRPGTSIALRCKPIRARADSASCPISTANARLTCQEPPAP